MEKQVIRTALIEKIKAFREKKLIKVITGVRRSGKSVLLRQFIDCLKQDDVRENQIVYISFEELENEYLKDYKVLHEHIKERLNPNGWTYIFLDEIQEVDEFQKTINSLLTKDKIDIYVTGSNSKLLSSELATLLTGRCIPIHVLPLSFKECASIHSNNLNPEKIFNKYMKQGGFPQTLELSTQKDVYDYLDSVYSTIIRKDILTREKSVDIGVLESITKFLAHNIGSLVSSTNIANALTSNKRKTSYNTVEKYIGLLKDCYIIYEVGRYDIKGKEYLKQNAKYYVVDTGLRNMLLANKETDLGHLLENIVYFELLRREYKVSIGQYGTKEIDFVATKDKKTEYYQVCASVTDKDTLARELEPLNNIKDHYPKYLITLDEYTAGNVYNGIQVINAIDFLLARFM